MNRTHRLRALGNAVVPAVAHVMALAVYDLLEYLHDPATWADPPLAERSAER